MDWSYITGAVTGAVTPLIVLAVPALIRWWRRPILDVQFDRRLDGCAMPTLERLADGTSRQAIYFSVKVTNKGGRTAKGSRGFLAGVDYRDNGGAWQRTEFCDSMPLCWAYRPDDDARHGIEIPIGISQLLNVFSEREGISEFLPRTAPLTTRQRAFERFAKPGDFRLRIFVTAEEAAVERYALLLRWGGQFDESVLICPDTSWP